MNRSGGISLKVLSPEKIILEEHQLRAVIIPLADGAPIGIHPGHAPLIAETAQGAIQYRSGYSEKKLNLHAGVLSVRENRIVVLTAGEAEETFDPVGNSSSSKYDRLMQTLAHQFQGKGELESDDQ